MQNRLLSTIFAAGLASFPQASLAEVTNVYTSFVIKIPYEINVLEKYATAVLACSMDPGDQVHLFRVPLNLADGRGNREASFGFDPDGSQHLDYAFTEPQRQAVMAEISQRNYEFDINCTMESLSHGNSWDNILGLAGQPSSLEAPNAPRLAVYPDGGDGFGQPIMYLSNDWPDLQTHIVISPQNNENAGALPGALLGGNVVTQVPVTTPSTATVPAAQPTPGAASGLSGLESLLRGSP